MIFDIMTLFPDLFNTVLGESVIGRAQKSGAVEINCHNILSYLFFARLFTDNLTRDSARTRVRFFQYLIRSRLHALRFLQNRPHSFGNLGKSYPLLQERVHRDLARAIQRAGVVIPKFQRTQRQIVTRETFSIQG